MTNSFKFFYQPAIALSPETGAPELVLRPEVPIFVHGSKGAAQYAALADTGADNTIFPKRIAEDLGIPLTPGVEPEVTAFGGQKLVVFFGEVVFEIPGSEDTVRWSARVQFFDFSNVQQESFVLGQSGFSNSSLSHLIGKRHGSR